MKDTGKQTVTIYTTNGFGSVSKYVGTIVDFGLKQYAQYDRAPFFSYVPKGKRNATGTVKGFQPYIVILKGNGHPEPADMLDKGTPDSNGVTVSKSRYMSFDERYKTDFDAVLNDIVNNNPSIVLMDCRHTMNTETVNKSL